MLVFTCHKASLGVLLGQKFAGKSWHEKAATCHKEWSIGRFDFRKHKNRFKTLQAIKITLRNKGHIHISRPTIVLM